MHREKTIRVIIILDSLNLGGAERQAYWLAEALQKSSDFEPIVIALSENGKMKETIQGKNIFAEVLPFRFQSSEFFRVLEIIRYTFRLRKLKPDIILPFTIRPNFIANLAWQLSGSKACCWNQRDEGFGFPTNGRGRIFNWALKNASVLIANSASTKKALEGYRKKNKPIIRLIQNGSQLITLPTKTDHFKKPIQAENRLVVTMVANLTIRKDHNTVIDAWNFLKKELKGNSMPLLILAGEKVDNYEKLQEKVELLGLIDDVIFVGQVLDITGLLSITDIAINSSVSEGMPNTVLEYMQAGKAIIASDILAHRELLGDNYDFFFSPGDYLTLAKQVSILIQDKENRIFLGEGSKELFSAKFSLKKMTETYMQLFRELCTTK